MLIPSMRFRHTAVLGLLLLLGFPVGARADIVLNEFLANNNRGLTDEDGEASDWIELRNTGGSVVNLLGWTLTDDPAVPAKWSLPATNIDAGGFLLVFASGKSRSVAGAPLHANFSLSAAGEYLGLFRPESPVPDFEFSPAYPGQKADISYGIGDGGFLFFSTPTPGAANGPGFGNFVADTKFSHKRGLYDESFDLVITCKTADATIRYTTNGATPTATTGIVYTGPIPIPGTRVIRAAAFKDGLQPSGVDTQTYLFPADVFTQAPDGKAPPGWPTTWGANVVNYGMDPDVVNSPLYRDELRKALASLPSFVIVTDFKNLFDSVRGIYANPQNDARAWERPASVELLNPDGKDGFQINCGLRIRGGYSRSTSNPKHAFRLFFRNEYGAGKLRYPLFGDGGADTFDNLDLRTFQNYSWSFAGDSRGVFIRDQFSRDTQLDLGQQAERGNYYHLFLNGQYWGLYNTCERPEASYGATYYGGRKEDFDVIKVSPENSYTIGATDGNQQAWNELYLTCKAGITNDAVYRKLLGQNPDGTPNPAYKTLVDPDNLIDYMMVIYFGGNLDAPISWFLGEDSPNNFYGMRDRTGHSGGFKFFAHDAEHTLLDVNEDRLGPFRAGSQGASKSNPQYFFQQLTASQEFRIRVADRVHRHFFNDGMLTPAAARARVARRTNEIFSAVVLESARWGDSKQATPFTRNAEWLTEINRIQQSYLSQRTSVILGQLRARGWYPAVDAPEFSRHGGSFQDSTQVGITAASGKIYFTTDGTDPRTWGGNVAEGARSYTGPVTLTESTVLKARVRANNGEWSALTAADFLSIQTWQDVLVTEIMYHPPDTEAFNSDDLEFLELRNVGPVERDLGGLTFTNGIRFTFPRGTRLAPGAFAVLVAHEAAFTNAHPGVPIAGVFGGRLDNAGERLTLVHATGAPVFDLAWGDALPWPESADGGGFSLVPRNPLSNPSPSDAAQWRASSAPGGSPGADDPPLTVPPVVVNEVLTHTDAPVLDSIELHNPTDAPADVSGWYLSDDRRSPTKFRIPGPSVIPPGGFLVLDEGDFNVPNAAGAFSLSSHGDEVFLFSADRDGALTGYSDGFSFGAAANGVSFGRHTNSVGEVQFPPQRALTLGAVNAGPRIGPIVLNEIQYAPYPGGVEFIEIANLTPDSIPLFDPEHPENAWGLSGADFSFPPDARLPGHGIAVVTSGDPTLFRLKWGVPDTVAIYGPYSGNLDDGGERITLERPDSPDTVTNGVGTVTVVVPFIAVDSVRYNNRAPWPVEAAGLGPSLERRIGSGYGDDPANWRAALTGPSPGLDNAVNRAPRPDAGSDQDLISAQFPLTTDLAATALDDGNPGGPLQFRWSQVGGPLGASVSNPTGARTSIGLPGQGVYTFRVTVSDGDRQASDDVVVQVRRAVGDVVLLPAGSVWKYLDNGSSPDASWNSTAFNDSGWSSGPARLGYGDPGMATTLNFGPDSNNKYITTYLRARFRVTGVASVTEFLARVSRDDGVVVYINGTEAARSNMPDGEITSSTTALSAAGGSDETTFFDAPLDRSLLREGDNVIAVELHQSGGGSSDLGFDLELGARALPTNTAPTAEAGTPLTVPAGDWLALNGVFQDDGLPASPGAPVFTWSRATGPNNVNFANAALPQTFVQFPTPGSYTLRFTVNDGEASVSDEVEVTVTAPPPPPAIQIHGGASPRLSFVTEPGRSYTVLTRTQLPSGDWTRVRDIAAGGGGSLVEIPVPEGDAERYYVVVTPAIP
ncbi:MAG: lamin tail domain-containing protein [Verrucomicrobiales bacterium]|nr:lamin tail domain-containing protein [Verrucomicrobiales bacterium]